MTRLLLAAVLLLAALPAAGQSNVWQQLSPTPATRWYGTHYDCTGTRSQGNPIGRSYSGIAYGNGQIMYWGGGHTSYQGNDVDLYDIATNRWIPDTVQPDCIAPCCAGSDQSCDNAPVDCAGMPPSCYPGSCAISGGSGSFKSVWRCSGGTRDQLVCSSDADCSGGTCSIGIPTPGVTCTTCKPYTEHAYQRQAYNPDRAAFLLIAQNGTWEWEPTARTWTRFCDLPPWGAGQQDKMVMWDPVNARILYLSIGGVNAGVWAFNYSTRAWVLADAYLPTGTTWLEPYGTWDASVSREILALSNTTTTTWYAYNPASTGASAWTLLDPTMPPELLVYGPSTGGVPAFAGSLAYDATNQRTIVLGYRSKWVPLLWAYNATANTWATIGTSGGWTSTFGSAGPGYLNPLVYDAGTGSLFFVDVTSVSNGAFQGGINVGTWKITLDLTNPLPTPTSQATTTPTQTPGPHILSWAERCSQGGVLACIGFHNATDVSLYGTAGTQSNPVYDPVQNAARLDMANTTSPTSLYNTLDTAGTGGDLRIGCVSPSACSMPWDKQFDENSEFEVQYLVRDDDWITEIGGHKFSIWSAGDRNPSTPPVTGGATTVGSCMPNDAVVSTYPTYKLLNNNALYVYHGCPSPAWGGSLMRNLGTDFADFSPPCSPVPNELWYQPAVPSCVYSQTSNGTADHLCTEPGANVWQAVTIHQKLGPRGLSEKFAIYPRWVANHTYAFGAYIRDSNNNIELSLGGTSGDTEPTWATPYNRGTITTESATAMQWQFYASNTDWFTNSYFWMALGWEGRPSTALVYKGPYSHYSPHSDLSYGDPPPKIGKLWLFPYRQENHLELASTIGSGTTFTNVSGWTDYAQATYPIGSIVTDKKATGYTGYTTLTQVATKGDTTLHVADTSTFHVGGTSLWLWTPLKAGSRWYKDVIIANGSTLADPFGIDPIVWPVPPVGCASWPGSSQPPSGEVPVGPPTYTPGPSFTITPIPTTTPTRTPSRTPTSVNLACPGDTTEYVFVPSATSDECAVAALGATYPPAGAPSAVCALSTNLVQRTNSGSGGTPFRVGVTLARWNTAHQPSGAAWPGGQSLVGAYYRLHAGGSSSSADAFPLVAQWYPWTTASASDYTFTYPLSSDATYAGTTSLVTGSTVRNVDVGSHLNQVNLSGYTGLRVTFGSGAQPTGTNQQQVYTLATSQALAEQLILCMSTAAGTPTPTLERPWAMILRRFQ